VHGDPIPDDPGTFRRITTLAKKALCSFCSLNLERKIPFESFRQTEVVKNAGQVENFFVEGLSARSPNQ